MYSILWLISWQATIGITCSNLSNLQLPWKHRKVSPWRVSHWALWDKASLPRQLREGPNIWTPSRFFLNIIHNPSEISYRMFRHLCHSFRDINRWESTPCVYNLFNYLHINCLLHIYNVTSCEIQCALKPQV